MKFAVNYSTPLKDLLNEGAVDVDLLKCPEWDGLVNAALPLRPVYVHFDIALGINKIQSLNFDLIRRMFATTDTYYLNVHLSNDSVVDPSSAFARKELLDRWKDEVAFLREQLPDQTIIAENLPWVDFLPQLEIACDPDLISYLIEECDLGLLLDLSHAKMSSHLLGIDVENYISRLPTKRLVELHITGIRPYAGSMTDHFELQPDNWPLVEWAHDQIKNGTWRTPEVVAFEYGGIGDVFCWRTRKDALRDQLPRLHRLFSDNHHA
ncbi:MAG: DUF692 family protein [Anaerolineaceae bacterium]|nr:DUF692 family protein [Anaerolineaceae bacterium]